MTRTQVRTHAPVLRQYAMENKNKVFGYFGGKTNKPKKNSFGCLLAIKTLISDSDV